VPICEGVPYRLSYEYRDGKMLAGLLLTSNAKARRRTLGVQCAGREHWDAVLSQGNKAGSGGRALSST